MRYAAGYLRRSVATTANPGNASREAQLAAISELCGPDVVPKLYEDWNVSGNGKNTKRRAEYLRLKQDIEAGEVSMVAAYSLSRIGRSLKEVSAFVELCASTNTKLVTKTDHIDITSATGRAMVGMIALMAQLESELASERTQSALDTVRAKGSRLGTTPIGYRAETDPLTNVRTFVPDGSADHILDAYRQTRTLQGAARLLAEQGVKSPRGKSSFSAVGLRGIIERNDVKLLPPKRPSGQRRRNKHALSGLIVCAKDGRTMTPDAVHKGLYCSTGRMQGQAVHGTFTVPYSRVMPLIRAETDRYMPEVTVTHKSRTDAQQQALAERRARLVEAYELGGITQADLKAKLVALDAERADLIDRDEAIEALTLEPSGVDWDTEPETLNIQLRRFFRKMTLNPSYASLTFDWKLPARFHDPAALAQYERELAEAS